MDQHCQRLEKMGSIRKRLHNDCVKVTDVKVKTKIPSKIRTKRDRDLMHSGSSATGQCIACSFLKHKKCSSRRTAIKNFVKVDTNDQEQCDGF